MISSLTGTVLSIGLDSLVLSVGGVGFLVRTTPAALADARTGSELTLHTELVVREDSLTLFGFPSSADADAFRTVQSVTGIGPRLALSVLAVLSPDDLSRAVAAQDTKAITRVPGIGPKVAGRMILELGGKLAPPAEADGGDLLAESSTGPGTAQATADGLGTSVVEALVGLGWQEKQAVKAVDGVRESIDPSQADAPTVLRESLRRLGGSR